MAFPSVGLTAPPTRGSLSDPFPRCPARETGRGPVLRRLRLMPTDLSNASTGGTSLLFQDDAAGCRFRLKEAQIYDAEEVRDQLGHGPDDPPAYGRWLSVEVESSDAWLVAPGEMVDELQRLGAASGEVFEVTRIEKSGTAETAPYEVNLEKLSDDAQTRL